MEMKYNLMHTLVLLYSSFSAQHFTQPSSNHCLNVAIGIYYAKTFSSVICKGSKVRNTG